MCQFSQSGHAKRKEGSTRRLENKNHASAGVVLRCFRVQGLAKGKAYACEAVTDFGIVASEVHAKHLYGHDSSYRVQ